MLGGHQERRVSTHSHLHLHFRRAPQVSDQGLPDLILEVHVGSGDEGANAWRLCALDGLPACADILFHAAGEAANRRPLDLICNRLHSLEVTRAGGRETRLNHIHTQAGQLMGYLQFLYLIKTYSRRLLPVTKRGVKQDHRTVQVATDSGPSSDTVSSLGHRSPPIGSDLPAG